MLLFLLVATGTASLSAWQLRPYFFQKIEEKLRIHLSKQLDQPLKISKIQLQYPDKFTMKNILMQNEAGDTVAFFRTLSVDVGLRQLLMYDQLRVDGMSVAGGHLYLGRLYAQDSLSRLRGELPVVEVAFRSFHITQLKVGSLRLHIDNDLLGINTAPLQLEMDAEVSEIVSNEDSVSALFSALHLVDLRTGLRVEQGGARLYRSSSGGQWRLYGLRLQTAQSHLYMSKASWSEPSDSSGHRRRLAFELELDSAHLKLSEWAPYLQEISPEVPFLDKSLSFSLFADGYVDNFRGRVSAFSLEDVLELEGYFVYRNIGQRHRYRLQVEEATSEAKVLYDLLDHRFSDWGAALGQLRYSGTLQGTPSQLQIDGNLDTDLGSFALNADVEDLRLPTGPTYRASLQSDTLRIAADMLPFPIDELKLEAEFRGKGLRSGEVEANLQHVGLSAQRNLRRVSLRASYAPSSLQLNASSDDPSLRFSAGLSWQSLSTQQLKAHLELQHLDLHALKLSDQPLKLHSQAEIDLRGTDWQHALGQLSLKDLHIQSNSLSLHEPELSLRIDSTTSGDYLLSLDSHPIALQLRSEDMSLEVIEEVYRRLRAALPLGYSRPELSTVRHYTASGSAQLSRLSPYFMLWRPEVPKFSTKSTMSFALHSDSSSHSAELSLEADTMHFLRNITYSNKISLSYQKQANEAPKGSFYYTAARHEASQLVDLEAPSVDIQWQGPSAHLQISVSEDTTSSYTRIRSDLHYLNDQWQAVFGDSYLHLLGTRFRFHKDSKLQWSPGKGLEVVDLKLRDNEEAISLQGHWLEEKKHLQLKLRQFPLLQAIVSAEDRPSGLLNADISLEKQPQLPMRLLAELSATDLSLKGIALGDANLRMSLAEDTPDKLQLEGYLRQQSGQLSLLGWSNLKRKDLGLLLEANKMPVHIIEPLLSPIFVDLRGRFDGALSLGGSWYRPEATGAFSVSDAYMRLDYTKAGMEIEGDIHFHGHEILLTDLQVKDGQGGELTLEGGLEHEGLLALGLDLNIALNQYQILNTHSIDNEQYYGKGYGSGSLSLSGTTLRPTLSGNIQTDANTRLYLPMYKEEIQQRKSFISFTDGKTDTRVATKVLPERESGFSMTLDLTVQPGTYCEIITQDSPPEYLNFLGEGELRLQLSSDFDFFVFGNLNMTQGNYRFSPYGLLSKSFELEPGCQMSWNGDPFDANVKIRMRYGQLVSAAPLQAFGETETRNNRRVYVNVILDLNGKLVEPNISFDLDIPEYQEGSTSLQYFRSDEQILKRQVVSLIFLNRFAPREGILEGGQASNTALLTSVGGEAVSAQLNNLLLDVDEDLSLGLDLARQRVSFSYAFLQGRLRLQREAALLPTATSQEDQISGILGDWDVEYMLSSSGKWRIKGYFNTIESAQPGFGRGQFSTGISLRYLARFGRWFYLPSRQSRKKPSPNKQQVLN